MKKITKKGVAFLLIAALFITGWNIPQTAAAATKNFQAIKAYKSLLSKKTYKWGESPSNVTANYDFACIDLNRDGVKELVVKNNWTTYAEGYCKVFAYVNHKIKCVTTCYDIDWYKKGKIIGIEDAHTGAYWGDFYQLSSKGKLIKKAHYSGTDMKEYAKHIKHRSGMVYYTSFQIANKEVSYKTYKKQLKRLLKSKKPTKFEYHQNTAANRKAFLK